MKKTKYKKHLTAFIILIVILLILYFSGITKFINYETFKSNKDYLLEYVKKHYYFSILVYIAFYILVVISTLPLAGVLSMFGGFLFGVVDGTFFSVVAGTIGSIFAFLIFRYILGKFIHQKYHKQFEKFDKRIEKFGVFYIILIQFLTVFPFFLVNILASLTNISLLKFALGTAIGVIPGTFLYAYMGKQLAEINSINEIFSKQFAIIFAIIIILFFISFIVKKIKRNYPKN